MLPSVALTFVLRPEITMVAVVAMVAYTLAALITVVFAAPGIELAPRATDVVISATAAVITA